MSICPYAHVYACLSFRKEQLGFHQMDFHEILSLSLFENLP